MRSVGVAVSMSGGPKAACVVLENRTGTETLVDGFDLTTGADGIAAQAHELARHLAARLPGLDAQIVVVQRADFAPIRSGQQARLDRLIVEGALVHAAMCLHVPTLLRNGKETGLACGSDKQTARTEGGRLDRARPDAAAAALSGLRKPT